jgi:SAM-dependent methyltransferase
MSNQNSPPANVPPSMQMMQLMWPGAMAVQAIHVAAKLGVADLLRDGPKATDDLADATKAHAPSLHRLLRALTSLGVFGEDAEGRFQQTQLSEILRTDHPQSIRAWAITLGAPFFWKPCGELYGTIRTGQPAFDRVHGERFFNYLAGHPEDAAVFNAAMSAPSTSLSEIVESYDWSRFERIVDVGGGQGALLQGILSANSKVRGVLYDLPEVVAGASETLRTGVLAERCETLGGDFFEAVPDGADAYILNRIVHDWNDADAVKILKNCRRAIRPDGRLLLLETVVTPTSDPARRLMDLLMLVLLGGRERTGSEFRALLREAGFNLSHVIPTAGPSIIESQPL